MLKQVLFTFIVVIAFTQTTLANDFPPDTSKSEMVYDMPEQMPEFPGGSDAMERFIIDNIKYPPLAKEKRIQGKVYVQFIVEKDGQLTEIKIRRGAHELLDQEAIRVIKLMPEWKPGSMRGRTVRTRYTVPITFALS
ncbi:energy transducer TonB [Paracrocinitomix mangrovi]|uniref:energy transducer TonB n=1 Tax=Paracrocinitomix mangrovi TaxID=2862509 RepID=UPI001C8DECB3|nr:energy transducer TonB [Paracrocinitomix mangrovi]UKN02151.1 energy transducer TonB [Paracrocinitomix mangrovi]